MTVYIVLCTYVQVQFHAFRGPAWRVVRCRFSCPPAIFQLRGRRDVTPDYFPVKKESKPLRSIIQRLPFIDTKDDYHRRQESRKDRKGRGRL